MAFSEQISYQEYPNSADPTFTITDFYFTDTEYIRVHLYELDGTVTEMEVGVDWSIAGTTITRITSWNPGTVLVQRDNLYNQLSTYRNAEIEFDREQLEDNLDYITMLAQQNQDIYNRAIYAPLFEDVDLELPIIDQRVGLFMTFDAQGNLVVRQLNSSDIGAANIDWLPTFVSYGGGEYWVVSYNGILYMAVPGAPVTGNPPDPANPAEWKVLTRGIEEDLKWQPGQFYNPNDIVVYNEVIYMAVTPVTGSAPGANFTEWIPTATNLSDTIYTWISGYPYAIGDLVLYNGYIFERENNVGADTTAPAVADGDWILWTDKTSNVITGTATITTGKPDEVVVADTTGGDFDITLADGRRTGDRLTVAAFGGGSVNVIGIGVNTPLSDSALILIWAGQWIILSGGGGGSGGLALGEITWWPAPETSSIPAGKLVVDGSLVLIADYPGLFSKLGTTWGGDGLTNFGIPNLQGIMPGALGTQDVGGNIKGDATAIGGIREDQMQVINATVNGTGETDVGSFSAPTGAFSGALPKARRQDQAANEANTFDQLVLDSSVVTRAGDYTRSTEAVGQWLIQAEPPEPALINAVVVDVEISDVRWSPATDLSSYDMVCDGTLLNISTYPELYARIGITYGGDGVTNFALPNLQGIAPGALGTQDVGGNTKGDATILGGVREDQLEDLYFGFTVSIDSSNIATMNSGGAGNALSPSNSEGRPYAVGSGLRVSQHGGAGASGAYFEANRIARVGSYTRPTELVGNWVIRVTQPAAYQVATVVETDNIADEAVTPAKILVSNACFSFEAVVSTGIPEPGGYMPYNTVRYNHIDGAVLSTNGVTLPPGTYQISTPSEGVATGGGSGSIINYLRNVDLGTDIAVGFGTLFNADTDNIPTYDSNVEAEFTLDVTTEIGVFVKPSGTTIRFCSGFNENKVGAYMKIQKIA